MMVLAETIVFIAEVRGQIAEVKPFASIAGDGSNTSYL